MHNYKEFKVWKRSIALNVFIYECTRSFPVEEKFGLVSQMRRSAISIPSNIAEGSGRRTDKDFAHFLSIAHGSICELESQLFISLELKFISKEDFEKIINELKEIQKMLYVLIIKFDS